MSGPGGSRIIRAVSGSRAALAMVHRGMGLAAGWVFVICAFFIAADARPQLPRRQLASRSS